jgi:two-component system, NtrC family, nitrogen regulation sensor histidine kinase NtrY
VSAPSRFALGLGIRAAALGALVFVVIQMLATQRLYANALVACALAAWVLFDLARYVTKGDRMLERFIDGLAAGEFERPAQQGGGISGFRHLAHALERAVISLKASRASREREIDRLQTLIDNVSVALLVIETDGTVSLANRAASRLAVQPINQLEHITAIGESAASSLRELAVGQRTIVRFANGQRVLASMAQFSAAGERRRLLSLQNIESELDAVELKAWRDLVRILAHEMMNSLTPIASLAESVKPQLEQLRGAGGAQDINDAVEAIARRSAGLMSFVERYRKMADLPRPALRTIRAADFMARIDQLMSGLLLRKNIAYASSMLPAHCEMRVDAELLEQALINLLHNAVDAVSAMPEPRIEVQCRSQDSAISISVSDNGPGVDPTTVDRIFVPFFTTKPGGSGIGLSLARQIAHAHGGRLEVARNAPQGAIFTLVISTERE